MPHKKGITRVPVEWVEPITLVPAPFNPAIRTERERLYELRKSMEHNGFLEYKPIVIGKDGIVGDGHRRLACAIDLGLPLVPVVHDPTRNAEEIWAEECTTSRAATAKETVMAVAQGLRILPDNKYRSSIKAIQRYAGQEGLVALADAKLSPSIHKRVKSVVGYVGRDVDEQGKPYEDLYFMRKTLFWLIEHRAQMVVFYMMNSGIDPQILEAYIEENKPPTWSIMAKE